MDFDLSKGPRLLKDSIGRLMLESYGFDHRRKYQSAKADFNEAMWARYAELGLLTLPFSQALGGALEMMILMESFGQAPRGPTPVILGLRRRRSQPFAPKPSAALQGCNLSSSTTEDAPAIWQDHWLGFKCFSTGPLACLSNWSSRADVRRDEAKEDATERAPSVSAANSQIGQSAKASAWRRHHDNGMQGQYFKGLTMIDTSFGDADEVQWLSSVAGLISDEANRT
ncbi:hypothetical protein ACVWWO_003284 [Bradyrhizobium sp. F1.13.1]